MISADIFDDVSQRVTAADISFRYKELILKNLKEDINRLSAQDFTQLKYTLRKWKWASTTNASYVYTVIDQLEAIGAGTILDLMTQFRMYHELELVPNKGEETKYRKRFSRALDIMVRCGLVEQELLGPEKVGIGKRSVTIWSTPWAMDREKGTARSIYLNRGGVLGTKKPAPEKDLDAVAEKVVNYNSKVASKSEKLQVEKIINKRRQKAARKERVARQMAEAEKLQAEEFARTKSSREAEREVRMADKKREKLEKREATRRRVTGKKRREKYERRQYLVKMLALEERVDEIYKAGREILSKTITKEQSIKHNSRKLKWEKRYGAISDKAFIILWGATDDEYQLLYNSFGDEPIYSAVINPRGKV